MHTFVLSVVLVILVRVGFPLAFRTLSLVVFGFAFSAYGETATFDFRAWDGVKTKTEDGWRLDDVLKYASDPLKGAAYLSKNGVRIMSPVFSKPILQVRIESAMTSAGEFKRDLRLIPYVDGTAVESILLERPLGKVFVEERIDLSKYDSTSFDLELSGSSGNWALRKITVVYGEYVPEVTSVSGVSVSGKESDSFSLAWMPVPDAVGYVVDVWTNENVFVHENSVVTNCSFDCAANPLAYGFSVKARFNIRGETVDSSAVTGRVNMASPPWFCCWKLSEFLPKPGFRVADFSGVVKSAWTNGVDGDFFYAFKNADPVTSVLWLKSNPNNLGLYCYEAGTEESPTNGLALRGGGDAAMRLILPMLLDAERSVEKLALSFSAREVKQGSAAQTMMSFAWATVDDIQAMDGSDVSWTDVPSASYVATNVIETRLVDIPVKPLRSGRYLCFKWSVPKQSNSSLIGLSDIKVAGKLRAGGIAIFIR